MYGGAWWTGTVSRRHDCAGLPEPALWSSLAGGIVRDHTADDVPFDGCTKKMVSVPVERGASMADGLSVDGYPCVDNADGRCRPGPGRGLCAEAMALSAAAMGAGGADAGGLLADRTCHRADLDTAFDMLEASLACWRLDIVAGGMHGGERTCGRLSAGAGGSRHRLLLG